MLELCGEKGGLLGGVCVSDKYLTIDKEGKGPSHNSEFMIPTYPVSDHSLNHEHQPRVLKKLRHRTTVEMNNVTPKYIPREPRPESKQGFVLRRSL